MANPDRFLLAGVMGWPVMHSRSPLMHNYWFRQHSLAGTYVPLAIEPAASPRRCARCHPLGFAGCNLTIPHKQAAMKIVDEVDAVAKNIGAISCVIVRPDGSLAGTNNDCYGFIHNFKQEQPGWRADAGPVVVIGAGGGSRAVCYGLAQEGAREIRVVNRSFARAQEIAEEFGGPMTALPWEQRHEALEDAAMVVNTTSQRHGRPARARYQAGQAAEARARSRHHLHSARDAVSRRGARQRGNPTVNGLGMLLHQGRPAWKAWFGIEPVVTAELRAIMEKSIREFDPALEG